MNGFVKRFIFVRINYNELVNKINFTKTAEQTATVTTSTLTYTGLSVTIPANKFYIVEAIGQYANCNITNMLIATSNTNTANGRTNAQSTTVGKGSRVQYIGFSGTSSVTYYLWAKGESAASTSVIFYAVYC